MLRCPHCDRCLGEQESVCSYCENSVRDTYDQSDGCGELEYIESDSSFRPADVDSSRMPLVGVARFSNAAEAGFFAHELMHSERIPATIDFQDHFDAMTGCWSGQFVLTVPQQMAESATVALTRLVEQTDGGEFFDGDDQASYKDADQHASFAEATSHLADDLEPSRINWVPIVLTLTAGSVVLWGARRMNEQPRPDQRKAAVPVAPASEPNQDLWEVLTRSPNPWTQSLNQGLGTRELQFDDRRNQAVIREDADGDGVFERRVEFDRAALNW